MSNRAEQNALIKSLRRLAQMLDIHSRRIDRAFGLTLPQLIVLTAIRDRGEVTSRAISVEAQLSPATVVGILDKLEAKELIERYRSTTDRRIMHTRLTTKGRRLLLRPVLPLGTEFEAAFRRLSAAERAALVASLHTIGSLMGAAPDLAAGEGAQDGPWS